MDDYQLMKTIFTNFAVGGVNIPVDFITYKGNSRTYVTYAFTEDDPTLFGDDKELGSVAYVDVDIFSDSNYLAIETKIKEIMETNNFIRTGSSPDMYEEDTGLYHKTLGFSKERMEI